MKYKTREYMAAPIVSGDTVLGVLTVVNRQRESGWANLPKTRSCWPTGWAVRAA